MSRSSKNNDKDKSKKDNSKKRKYGDEGSNNNDADNVLPFGEKPTHLTIINEKEWQDLSDTVHNKGNKRAKSTFRKVISINEKGWKALSNAVSNGGNECAESTFKKLISSINDNGGEHEDKSNENGGHEGMDYSSIDSLNTEDYLQKLRDTYIQESINNVNKVMDGILHKLLAPARTEVDNIKTDLDNDEQIKQQIEQHKTRIASWKVSLDKDPTYTGYNKMIEKEKTQLTNVTKTYTERVKKIKDDTDEKVKEHFKTVLGRDIEEFGEYVQDKLDLVLQDIKLDLD